MIADLIALSYKLRYFLCTGCVIGQRKDYHFYKTNFPFYALLQF